MWQVQELQRQQRDALEEARRLRADAQPLEAPATYSQVRICINGLAQEFELCAELSNLMLLPDIRPEREMLFPLSAVWM